MAWYFFIVAKVGKLWRKKERRLQKEVFRLQNLDLRKEVRSKKKEGRGKKQEERDKNCVNKTEKRENSNLV